MRKDQIFVLLLVVLLPLTGCFDGGGIGDADAQDSTESGNSGTSVTTTPSLRTHFTTISPSNLNCGDDDVCVWEYAMTITHSSPATEAALEHFNVKNATAIHVGDLYLFLVVLRR